jgi:hypothetical protein
VERQRILGPKDLGQTPTWQNRLAAALKAWQRASHEDKTIYKITTKRAVLFVRGGMIRGSFRSLRIT